MDDALTRLGDATGLRIEWDANEGGQVRVREGKQVWTFQLIWKPMLDRVAALQQVHGDAVRGPHPNLLVTPYLTQELATTCVALGLCFIDLAGNAFLKGNGLYVLMTGKRPEKALIRAERPMRAFDRTGLRVVFVLLVAPNLLEAPYRDIAKAAGIALGSVGRILTDLRDHGFLVEDGPGKRHWIDRPRAVQAWEANYPLRLRDRLTPRRYAARSEDWWHQADPAAFGGCWGGEVAVARMQGDLVPSTQTLYLPGDRTPFLAKHRLKADPKGPIEILERFWDLPGEGTLAPPLLVHADLIQLGHPRALEAARRIHDHILA